MRMPRILHVVSRREIKDEETKSRCSRAFESWSVLYSLGGVVPVHVWENNRDARSIGSTRDLPFLKDVLQCALDKAESPYDVVFFTNDDNILHPLVVREVRRHCELYNTGSLRRVDIDSKDAGLRMPPLSHPPVAFLNLGRPHVGRDGFVFNAGWLKDNLQLIPDFLLGAWGWDVAVSILVRLVAGQKVTALQQLYDTIQGCELPDGILIHLSHDAMWSSGTWNEKAENRHNQRLFNGWARRYCPSLKDRDLIEPHTFPISAIIRAPEYARVINRNLLSLAAEL